MSIEWARTRFESVIVTLLLALGACAPKPADSATDHATLQPHRTDEASAVMAYTAAFNAHDVEAMRALMTDGITWFSIVGDSLVVEAEGAEALASGLTAYFGDFPDVTSEVQIGETVGAYVHAHETASWSRGGVRSSQSSLSTYEIRNGRVARVWYFPSGS